MKFLKKSLRSNFNEMRRYPILLKNILPLIIVVVISSVPALAVSVSALEVPHLTRRVNDFAGMISPSMEAELENRLRVLEGADSTQLVVLTINSLEGEPIEDYSIKVAQRNAIGQRGYDNGILLLVAKDERRVRIEVGYGLEGSLTDIVSGRIIDNEITPFFKSGRFDEGFSNGVDKIIEAVKGEYKGTGRVKSKQKTKDLISIFYPFIIIFIILSMIGKGRHLFSGIVGAILFPIAALMLLSLNLWIIIALIPLGFFLGLIFPFFSVFSPYGGYYNYSRGGRGGFGGFGGGGGGFGGGGASGGW